MSFWRNLLLGPAVLPTVPALSWMSPQNSLESLVLPDDVAAYLKDSKGAVLDMAAAMRIPAFKRSHDVHCGVLARMPWRQYDGDTQISEQPSWLVTSKSGVSPRHLRWGVASDSFAYGSALIGFELDGDQPVDALHIPFGKMWNLDKDGLIQVSTRVPSKYRQRVIWLQLGYGSNGMLVDATDTLNDARGIEAAYRDRIANPIAQTMLTIAADRWDGWSKEEREEFRQMFMNARSAEGGATGMKPDWITVDYSGQLPSDLFESGRNANRLDMANHAGLPASIVEGSKQGGGSDIKYSGVSNGATRNELWDYGLSKYADAWEGRLSLDDVCPTGQSIRVDASHFLVNPNPTEPQTSED